MKLLLLICCFNALCLQAQRPIASLPTQLAETSALLLIEEEFYSLNDSGNTPALFVFNKEGEILHECVIKNAENYDWEALAYDGTSLYIGDIGNNDNNRQNLRVYKVNRAEIRSKKEVNCKVLNFKYEDQTSYPPDKSALYFDAEALVYRNDSLFILTKNRTEPFDGVSRVYYLPSIENAEGKVEAIHLYDLQLNATNWMEESITDAYLCNDKLYVLTYSKIYSFIWNGSEFNEKKVYEFDSFTQKEGLTLDKKHFYLTDEDESIISGGNHLYKLKR